MVSHHCILSAFTAISSFACPFLDGERLTRSFHRQPNAFAFARVRSQTYSYLHISPDCSLDAACNMTKVVAYVYSLVLILSWVIGGTLAAKTSGPLPGCRYVVRPTERWFLPVDYRTPEDRANWDKGVCASVKTATTYGFPVYEPVYIRAQSGIKCGGNSTTSTTYCVTSRYRIVKCGDIGCEQRPGIFNTCDLPISQDECDDRYEEAVESDVDLIHWHWDNILNDVEIWLRNHSVRVVADRKLLSKIRGAKKIIIDAIKLEVAEEMTPAFFRKIFIDAIQAAVPDSVYALTLKVPTSRKISLSMLVWDVFNAAWFTLKMY
jgi:hypothetical protein